MQKIRRLAVAVCIGLAAIALGGRALASPCNLALASYSNAIYPVFSGPIPLFPTLSGGAVVFLPLSGATAPSATGVLSTDPECFGGGATTMQASISGTSFQHIAAISNGLSKRWASDEPGPRARLGTSTRGMAAGGIPKDWNTWGNVGLNDTRHSYLATSNSVTRNEWEIRNTVFGADYALSRTLVVGVSGAIDFGDGTGLNNVIDTKGYALAPYIGMQLSKELVLDASLGLGKGRMSSSNNTRGEANRWFAAVNMAYERWMGNLQFNGQASYLRGVEDYGNMTTGAGTPFLGTDAKNTLGQLRLSGQAGYWMSGFMPYVSLGYVSDVERKTTQFAVSNPIGRNAWVWSVGANVFSLPGGMVGGFAYRREEGRDSQKNYSLTANLNIRF